MKRDIATLTCVVNTYNCAHFIEQCVESLLSQETKYQVTIIIIDDCSTDKTSQVVKNIQQKNPKNNVHFFSTKKNNGLGKHALQELESEIQPFLKADYIYRIDSDDYLIDPSKFEKQISFLESHPECIGICHHYKLRDEKNNIESTVNDTITGIYSTKELLKLIGKAAMYNHTSTYLYRNIHKSVMPPEFKKLSWARGDVLYNWAMLRYGKVCFTNDVMSVYRINEKGAWNSLPKTEQKRLNDLLILKIFLLLTKKDKLYFIFHRFKLLVKEIKKLI